MSEEGQKIKNQFLIIETYRDFIEWIFDNQIDWMTEREAWDEFDKHQEKLQTNDK